MFVMLWNPCRICSVFELNIMCFLNLETKDFNISNYNLAKKNSLSPKHLWKGYCVPGEALTLERGMGCAAVTTPFFQANRRSLAHQFTVNVPLLCPLFSIFRKFLHFQPCFGQNFSSLDPNFSKFSFPRPHFFKENLLPETLHFETRMAHTHQKEVECPPRMCYSPLTFSMMWFFPILSFLFCLLQGLNNCLFAKTQTSQHKLDYLFLFNFWK